MDRSMAKVGLLLLALTIALSAMGVGYGLWFKVLTINGTVNTGTVLGQFSNDSGEAPFTNDDGVVDKPHTVVAGLVTVLGKDDQSGATVGQALPGTAADDDGTIVAEVFDGNGTSSSADPNAPGFNPTRYTKDVGECTAAKSNAGGDTDDTLNITVQKGYPSYWCTTWFHIKNTGAIPVDLVSITLTAGLTASQAITPSTYWCVDVDGNGLISSGTLNVDCGANYDLQIHVSELAGIPLQIDPGGANPQGNVDIHVEQDAGQGLTGANALSFGLALQLNQWNEQ